MKIGVDLDNTIVRYDAIIHQAAVERGLIPRSLPVSKEAVRDWLRERGREEDWTLLQGTVYGPLMERAAPFDGALEFLRRLRRAGISWCIISHRTRRPLRGPSFDLHEAAWAWLARHGFFEGRELGLARAEVHLETTRERKLRRVRREGLDCFIDDLPEFLADPGFPPEVERILFDPADRHPDSEGVRRLTSWPRIGSWLRSRSPRPRLRAASAARVPAPLQAAARRLVRTAGWKGALDLRALEGAANNRAFRARVGGDTSLFLKAYFRHPADRRDRLKTEFAFISFAWDAGLRSLPRPLACDPEAGLGLYEFIPGRKLAADELGRAELEAALAFYRGLNRHRGRAAARRLSDASESAFSLAGHLARVESRIAAFRSLRAAAASSRRARGFVLGDLSRTWLAVRARVLREAERLGLDPGESLPPDRRRLSPSDFGFHNALRAPGGALKFIDFEYAGWDDPAKTACDFFCQPAIPVPRAWWEPFARELASDARDPSREFARMELLLPVYQVKWCLIMLNEFLVAGQARRDFARIARGQARLAGQLQKARTLLAAVTS